MRLPPNIKKPPALPVVKPFRIGRVLYEIDFGNRNRPILATDADYLPRGADGIEHEGENFF